MGQSAKLIFQPPLHGGQTTNKTKYLHRGPQTEHLQFATAPEVKGVNGPCILSCVRLCDLDCSLPGSSVHGISQARILEWVATTFSGKSS